MGEGKSGKKGRTGKRGEIGRNREGGRVLYRVSDLSYPYRAGVLVHSSLEEDEVKTTQCMI